MSDQIVFNSIGSGKPLLLIHPLGLDHHIWDFCIEDFAKIRRVITYDLPGHGINAVPEERYEIEDLSKDLCEACLLYTSPSPRDLSTSRMPSSA